VTSVVIISLLYIRTDLSYVTISYLLKTVFKYRYLAIDVASGLVACAINVSYMSQVSVSAQRFGADINATITNMSLKF
jgi:hypothetical protein